MQDVSLWRFGCTAVEAGTGQMSAHRDLGV